MSRLRRLDDGRYEYSPKKGTAFTLTAAARLLELGVALPSRVLPQATAPPQLLLAM